MNIYEIRDDEGKRMLRSSDIMLAYRFMKVCEANNQDVIFLIGEEAPQNERGL